MKGELAVLRFDCLKAGLCMDLPVFVSSHVKTSLSFLSEDRKDAFGIFYVAINLSTLNHPEEPYRALGLYRLESVKDWS